MNYLLASLPVLVGVHISICLVVREFLYVPIAMVADISLANENRWLKLVFVIVIVNLYSASSGEAPQRLNHIRTILVEPY